MLGRSCGSAFARMLSPGGLLLGCTRRCRRTQLEGRTAHRAPRACRRPRPSISPRQGPRARSAHPARTLAGPWSKERTSRPEWNGVPKKGVLPAPHPMGPCLEIRPLDHQDGVSGWARVCGVLIKGDLDTEMLRDHGRCSPSQT